MAGKRRKNEEELARRRLAERGHGVDLVRRHGPLAAMESAASVFAGGGAHGLPAPSGWGYVTGDGQVVLNEYRDGDPQDWAWAIGHLLLHLALGHLDRGPLREALAEAARDTGRPRADRPDAAHRAACCTAAHRFALDLRLGKPFLTLPSLPAGDERSLAARWRREGIPDDLRALGVNGDRDCMVLLEGIGDEPPPAALPAAVAGGPGGAAGPGGPGGSAGWSGGPGGPGQCGPSGPPGPPGGFRHGRVTGSYRTDGYWADRFAAGLARTAEDAIADAARARGGDRRAGDDGPWQRALSWFTSSYPLLGALATGLTVVADPEIARGWDITIAAVNPEHGEIYVNPAARLSGAEWRFVMAHEMLHAALRHDLRLGGRDPELFNAACDFVINGWLVEMGVGAMPEGLLYDPELAGLSAESVYDTLATDLRRARKLRGHGARGHGDVLGDWLSEPAAEQRRASRRRHQPRPLPWERAGRAGRASAVDLDEFYRRSLTTGLQYHGTADRGLVPSGLVEEIRALEHPPLPWDARLARWFDAHVRTPEPQRSYARASRRQASTPDIPRPGRYRPERPEQECTFGVVLDTSGSMDTGLLAKALGAISSYAVSRDVPAVRVVFCDAAAYDAGYLSPEEIAGRVRVRGRGGTVLQPGIRLLERAADFPADGPILVITDGACDVLRVSGGREHAYLMPGRGRLPFTPKGPVFQVR